MDHDAKFRFKKFAKIPCPLCLPEVLDYLTDPRTHTKLEPYLASRQNMLVLHVHKKGLLDDPTGEHAVLFLTPVFTGGRYMPLFTPSGKNLDDALDNLRELLTFEELRKERYAKQNKRPSVRKDVRRRAEGGVRQTPQRSAHR